MVPQLWRGTKYYHNIMLQVKPVLIYGSSKAHAMQKAGLNHPKLVHLLTLEFNESNWETASEMQDQLWFFYCYWNFSCSMYMCGFIHPCRLNLSLNKQVLKELWLRF